MTDLNGFKSQQLGNSGISQSGQLLSPREVAARFFDLSRIQFILFTMFAHAIELSESATPGVTRVVSKNEASKVVGHAEELLQVA